MKLVDFLKQYDTDISYLSCISLQFLLRACNVSQLRSAFTEHYDTAFPPFKDGLRFTGYFHSSFKVWAYYCIKRNLTPKKAKACMKAFGVYEEDFEVLRLYMKNRRDFPISTKYRAYTKKALTNAMTRTLRRCTVSAKVFVYRKLRFLTVNSGLTLEDLQAEILMKAYDSLLLQYPAFDCALHRDNVCRQAIHNNGLNTLYYYNNKSRATMQNLDGKFVCTNTYYADHKPGLEVKDNGDSHLDILVNEEYYDSTLDDKLTYQSVLRSFKGKERRFIKLLAGVYNPGFSRYIGKDNDEAFDKMPIPKYQALCADYLDISNYQSNVIINKLKQQLGAYL